MNKLFKDIRHSDVDAVRVAISKNITVVNEVYTAKAPKKDIGQSPLQVAIKCGEFEIIELLVNPKCYEKEDGTLLIGLALTEDTDSLFPIVPEEQWAIEGKTISEWIITMVSLTNPQGGIIGQMEYHEAIKRLEPFILMKKDNWALIRAMTHEELDSLFGNLPRKLY